MARDPEEDMERQYLEEQEDYAYERGLDMCPTCGGSLGPYGECDCCDNLEDSEVLFQGGEEW